MDEITALAKRRGFIFQSSEIYGGIGGFWDYGPLGAVLKRNVRDAWWREIVQLREDVVPFDSSIVMHPLTWKVSGHLDVFADTLVDCRVCKHRFRADHLPSLEKCPGLRDERIVHRASSLQPDAEDVRRPAGRYVGDGVLAAGDGSGHLREFQKHLSDGATEAAVWHRAGRQVVSERDHARNFTFRSREFEQMELEFFVPHDGNDMLRFREWVEVRKKWYAQYGIRADRLRFYEMSASERPHYAQVCVDVEYEFPWGWGELESIAHRGTYDLDAIE